MSGVKVRITWTVLRRFLGKRLSIRVRAYLLILWFICSYCGLFANNVVSFADNVVLRPLLFAVNVVSISACLQFEAFMFAVPYS
jgi:hypothetical protein